MHGIWRQKDGRSKARSQLNLFNQRKIYLNQPKLKTNIQMFQISESKAQNGKHLKVFILQKQIKLKHLQFNLKLKQFIQSALELP